MIRVSRLNKENFLLNPDLIEMVEETPDTVVTMTSGRKFVISESSDDVIDRIVEYRQRIYVNLPKVKKQ